MNCSSRKSAAFGGRMLPVLWLVLAVHFCAQAGEGTGTSGIEEVAMCFEGRLASYDSWRTYLKARNEHFDVDSFERRIPRKTYEAYRHDLACEFFRYPVDRLSVGGFWVYPKSADSHPIVLFFRGGTGTFGRITAASLFDLVLPLAMEGYFVAGSQYRGGLGLPAELGGVDEWGSGDVEDSLALLEIVENHPAADPSRLGLVGGSRGSMTMFLAAGRIAQETAIVSLSGVYDLNYDLGFRPSMGSVYQEHMRGFGDDPKRALSERSFGAYLTRLDANAPILLLHGQYDERTSLVGALRFAQGLQDRWLPFRLVTYPMENHFFSKHERDVFQEIVRWLGRYVKDRE